jgi:hypothetical protein
MGGGGEIFPKSGVEIKCVVHTFNGALYPLATIYKLHQKYLKQYTIH